MNTMSLQLGHFFGLLIQSCFLFLRYSIECGTSMPLYCSSDTKPQTKCILYMFYFPPLLCVQKCINQTSLLVEAMMQEPVTVRVTGEEEPSTQHDRFSYLVSLISSLGAKVTSKGTSMPGQI